MKVYMVTVKSTVVFTYCGRVRAENAQAAKEIFAIRRARLADSPSQKIALVDSDEVGVNFDVEEVGEE